LIQELKSRFPRHDVLDAHSVVYPQYWLSPDADSNFTKHLHVLKRFYGEPKAIVEGDNQRVVQPILDSWQLDVQQAYFKLAIKSNSKAAM
jgi:hypothetical protein